MHGQFVSLASTLQCWSVKKLNPDCSRLAGLLGRHNSITTNEIIDRNVLTTMVSLIQSVKHKNQLAGLKVISGLALSSETAAKKLLTKELLVGLKVGVMPKLAWR